MTSKDFKKGLNAEIATDFGIIDSIYMVEQVGVNTALHFRCRISQSLEDWLNKRFSNGVRLSTYKTTAFLNTPNEKGKKQ